MSEKRRRDIPERPVKKAQITAKKLRMNNAMTPRAKCSLVDSSVSPPFSIVGK